MALGKRTAKQTELFVPVTELPKTPAHPFYAKLNTLLAGDGFDPFVEDLCERYYKDGGRPSIPPGTYFRMLFIGYFEGIDSQRGIAWRCADSRSLREFLGVEITEATPAHNSMTVIRQRLPESVFESVFARVLGILDQKGLLKGKRLGSTRPRSRPTPPCARLCARPTAKTGRSSCARWPGPKASRTRRMATCGAWTGGARTRRCPMKSGRTRTIPTRALRR
jgi:hypothetical protein